MDMFLKSLDLSRDLPIPSRRISADDIRVGCMPLQQEEAISSQPTSGGGGVVLPTAKALSSRWIPNPLPQISLAVHLMKPSLNAELSLLLVHSHCPFERERNPNQTGPAA
ncbi:hypothetical protein LOK49_LG12G02970 [Camellia lanceoleosa]|uniref:Uncharacterized protein n=1 Tax=Camellia lanceoleosa TaxID=1840588 RepID=A0ACC0FVM9_9ERIC|nr:hypothetical protein LOK49_LG12G02970 [Camellia lanceoleosa]